MVALPLALSRQVIFSFFIWLRCALPILQCKITFLLSCYAAALARSPLALHWPNSHYRPVPCPAAARPFIADIIAPSLVPRQLTGMRSCSRSASRYQGIALPPPGACAARHLQRLTVLNTLCGAGASRNGSTATNSHSPQHGTIEPLLLCNR